MLLDSIRLCLSQMTWFCPGGIRQFWNSWSLLGKVFGTFFSSSPSPSSSSSSSSAYLTSDLSSLQKSVSPSFKISPLMVYPTQCDGLISLNTALIHHTQWHPLYNYVHYTATSTVHLHYTHLYYTHPLYTSTTNTSTIRHLHHTHLYTHRYKHPIYTTPLYRPPLYISIHTPLDASTKVISSVHTSTTRSSPIQRLHHTDVSVNPLASGRLIYRACLHHLSFHFLAPALTDRSTPPWPTLPLHPY